MTTQHTATTRDVPTLLRHVVSALDDVTDTTLLQRVLRLLKDEDDGTSDDSGGTDDASSDEDTEGDGTDDVGLADDEAGVFEGADWSSGHTGSGTQGGTADADAAYDSGYEAGVATGGASTSAYEAGYGAGYDFATDYGGFASSMPGFSNSNAGFSLGEWSADALFAGDPFAQPTGQQASGGFLSSLGSFMSGLFSAAAHVDQLINDLSYAVENYMSPGPTVEVVNPGHSDNASAQTAHKGVGRPPTSTTRHGRGAGPAGLYKAADPYTTGYRAGYSIGIEYNVASGALEGVQDGLEEFAGEVLQLRNRHWNAPTALQRALEELFFRLAGQPMRVTVTPELMRAETPTAVLDALSSAVGPSALTGSPYSPQAPFDGVSNQGQLLSRAWQAFSQLRWKSHSTTDMERVLEAAVQPFFQSPITVLASAALTNPVNETAFYHALRPAIQYGTRPGSGPTPIDGLSAQGAFATQVSQLIAQHWTAPTTLQRSLETLAGDTWGRPMRVTVTPQLLQASTQPAVIAALRAVMQPTSDTGSPHAAAQPFDGVSAQGGLIDRVWQALQATRHRGQSEIQQALDAAAQKSFQSTITVRLTSDLLTAQRKEEFSHFLRQAIQYK